MNFQQNIQNRFILHIFLIESRNKAGLTHLKEIVNSIGGWPLIDSNWNPENYHWEDAYPKAKLLYGSEFPFSLSVTKDVKNLSENVVEVIILTNYRFEIQI